ncbi:transposase [Streptomyces sp. PTY087I2]|uniref:transposase n=1 Tax=Streptomyces sp. PTY087I2 TaxID=1819298 RepID=UPI00350E58D2
MGTSPWIVPDDLWERIELLLPKKGTTVPVSRSPSGPGLSDPGGILYVLHTGIQWERLPQEQSSGQSSADSVIRCDRDVTVRHHGVLGMWGCSGRNFTRGRAWFARCDGLLPGARRSSRSGYASRSYGR